MIIFGALARPRDTLAPSTIFATRARFHHTVGCHGAIAGIRRVETLGARGAWLVANARRARRTDARSRETTVCVRKANWVCVDQRRRGDVKIREYHATALTRRRRPVRRVERELGNVRAIRIGRCVGRGEPTGGSRTNGR